MKRNKGITLVALIITIIIMLILVAVSVRIAIKTGLLDAAGKSTQKWTKEAEAEGNLSGIKVGDKNLDEYMSNLEGDKKIDDEVLWKCGAVGSYNEGWILGINVTEDQKIRQSEISHDNYRGRSYVYNLGIDTLTVPNSIKQQQIVNVKLDIGAYSGELEGTSKLVFSEGIKKIKTGESIPWYRFSMPDLKEITFPTSLEELENGAFYGFPQLSEHIDLSNTNLKKMGYYVFHKSTVTKISLPSTVTEIGDLDNVGVSNRMKGGVSSKIELAFPNGINETLQIPTNMWGYKKITIKGVEYTPGT